MCKVWFHVHSPLHGIIQGQWSGSGRHSDHRTMFGCTYTRVLEIDLGLATLSNAGMCVVAKYQLHAKHTILHCRVVPETPLVNYYMHHGHMQDG